jgi:hypothetical protein
MRKPLPLPCGIRSKLVVVGARKADETIFPFLGRTVYHTRIISEDLLRSRTLRVDIELIDKIEQQFMSYDLYD